jgi:hypothetical protein
VAVVLLFGTDRGQLRRVDELFERGGRFDIGQVFDELAAQADEEAGEYQRHQPQQVVHPLLGQPQSLAHVCLLSR